MIPLIDKFKSSTAARSKNSFSVIIRLVLFVTIFFMFLFFFEPLFQMNYQRMTLPIYIKTALAKEKEFDVFFLGSSHVSNAIDPVLIERILPIQTESLWMPGVDTNNAYFLLKKAVELGKTPKVVVFDSFSLLDIYGNHQGMMIHDGLDIQNRLLEIKDAIQFFPPEEQLSNFNVMFHNHDLWKQKATFTKNLETFDNYYLRGMNETKQKEIWGFFFRDNTKTINAYTPSMVSSNQFDIAEVNKFDDYTKYQLLRLLNYCRSHNISFMIIDIPTLNTSGIDLPALRDFCNEKGIPFYDYGTIFRGKYEYRYIFHSEGGRNSHMNNNGKLMFTADYIIPMLAEELNLDYDQKAIIESTELVHVGLNVTGLDDPDNQYLTFTLIPLNPELSLNYHWMLKKDKSSVIYEQNGTDNTFMISKNKWGATNIQIEVEVTNPSNNDQLIVFTIPLS